MSQRLEKASAFLKAIRYKYDRMQLLVGLSGKPVSISNKDELRHRWVKMKQRLKKDDQGEVVDTYFEKQDKQFITNSPVWNAVSQYFYFGLVFPQIPIKHLMGWSRKRMIKFSENEEEFFEEQITHRGTENNIENYLISGNALPDSATTLLGYQGSISKKKMDILPEKATVEISFQRSDIFTQWHFILQRIQL